MKLIPKSIAEVWKTSWRFRWLYLKIIDILHNSPLEVSINMKLRYMPVVERLKKLWEKNKNLMVLEIGSGSKGITRFFKHPVVGMDIIFQEHKNKYLMEIVGSATKKFPFKSGEFDVVISVDTIEHIPRKQRLKSLKEMLRVSNRYIIIAGPFEITKWNKLVLKKWLKSSPTYINIKEHLDCEIPDGSEIRKVFKNCRINLAYGAPSGLSYFIKLLERNIIGKVFSRTVLKLLFPIFNLMKGHSRRCYFMEKSESLYRLSGD